MWRSILSLVLLMGFMLLSQTPPVDAQTLGPPALPGACQTTPCQNADAVPCLHSSGLLCATTLSGNLSLPLSCSGFPAIGLLTPTGGVHSAGLGARYATYSDNILYLQPRIGPNPQYLVADANLPYSPCAGYLAPIFGWPGSWGYNTGPRRGFTPFSSADAYRQTLDAVVAPNGAGYLLSWTTGTTFSNSSHEVFQCAEADTPLVACRSVAVVNAETRTFGPVPGGYTYVVRSQGYSGYTGTIGWGGQIEAGSSRLPLPLVPPPTAGSAAATQ
jgi:hypothetical protein